jgi:glycogen synthase
MADLAQALASAGHRVTLLSDECDEPAPPLPRVDIRRLRPAPAPSIAATAEQAPPETAPHNLLHAAAVYREVRRLHEREGRLDAVLAPLWRSEGALCALDPRFPTIVSCMTSLRTLTEIDPRYHHLPDLGQRLALEREALTRSRYLHGLTRAALDKTLDDYSLRPLGTAVIPRGLRDRRGRGKAHPAMSDRASILFVGRIERRKGVDVLFEAVRRLIGDGLDAEITFAGASADPDLQSACDRQLEQDRRLAGAVRFTGHVSEDELTRRLDAADIVCVPSRYESHGVVLLEAMMFGKAIVTSDAGGILEVVTPDHDALVVPTGNVDALARALARTTQDAELRAALAVNARRTYERRYEVGAVARQMVGFIEQIQQHRPRFRLHRGRDVAAELTRLLADALGLDRSRATSAAAELVA